MSKILYLGRSWCRGAPVAGDPAEEVRAATSNATDGGSGRVHWRSAGSLTRLKEETLAVVCDLDIALLTAEMADLRGHPVLQIRYLGKSVGNLEPLEFSNDLGSAGVLVKVDNSDATIAILLRLGTQAHLLGGRVANVDKCQVGQVHAEEG